MSGWLIRFSKYVLISFLSTDLLKHHLSPLIWLLALNQVTNILVHQLLVRFLFFFYLVLALDFRLSLLLSCYNLLEFFFSFFHFCFMINLLRFVNFINLIILNVFSSVTISHDPHQCLNTSSLVTERAAYNHTDSMLVTWCSIIKTTCAVLFVD